MTFYVFQNGVDAMDADPVMGNFNEILYQVVMNQIDKDIQSVYTCQNNKSIMSDWFCDCTGKFDTICTTDTTAIFRGQSYSNYEVSTVTPFCHTFICDVRCGNIISATPYNMHVCAYNGNSAIAWICSCCTSTDFCICNYYSLKFMHCGWMCIHANDDATIVGIKYTVGDFSISCIVHTKSCQICLSTVTEWMYKCENTYDVYCNNSYMCTICGNNVLPFNAYVEATGHTTRTSQTRLCICYYSVAIACAPSTKLIATKYKVFDNPKSSIYFDYIGKTDNNSSITLKILDESGNVYADNVMPHQIYTLANNDKCCFKIQIYLNCCCHCHSPSNPTGYVDISNYAIIFS